MRKASAYLPLYGNDFFESIAGYPDAVGMGYLRALWHYWNHTSCEGLPDDDEYLRRVCGADASDWERTRSILFDNRYHFRLVDGVWQQPRCREEVATNGSCIEGSQRQRYVQRNEERNVKRYVGRYVAQSPSPSPSPSESEPRRIP